MTDASHRGDGDPERAAPRREPRHPDSPCVTATRGEDPALVTTRHLVFALALIGLAFALIAAA